MGKQSIEPGMLLGPIPAALVSCAGKEEKKNIITLAWVGVVNSDPPMVSIAIRPSRYSHDLITESKEFTVNIPTSEMVEVVDRCGVSSGRDLDKFETFELTPLRGTLEYAPFIGECPLCLECKVTQVINLGSHDLFLGKVVNVMVEKNMLNKDGRFDPGLMEFLGFSGGHYMQARKTGREAGFTRKK